MIFLLPKSVMCVVSSYFTIIIITDKFECVYAEDSKAVAVFKDGR